jgi:hypothetical protein
VRRAARPARGSERYPFAPGLEHADDFAPHETSGPALLVGVGELYAGLGARAAYQLTLREQPLSFAPHFGAGYGLAFDGRLRAPGVRGGVQCAYGRDQRWLVDLAYGALAGHELRLHGVTAAARAVYGVSFALGFEAVDAFGVIGHVLIGPYYLTSRGVAEGDRLGVAIGLGIGWKPW